MEMNMHMPQNVCAETELKHLAAIPHQIVSPSSNSPIIGIYQDSMLGSFQFTRDVIEFTPKDAMNLLMMYPNVDVDALVGKEKITNFEVLTQIMPHVTLKYKNKLFKDDENEQTSNNIFELRNGEYMRGQLEKSVLASSTKGIIHRAFNDYGNMAAANFIDNLQNVVTEYMKSSSFSVGVSDLIANRETQTKIAQAILAQKLEVQSVIEKVHLGIFENDTSNTNMAEFEMRVNNILNKATEQSGKIGHSSLGKENRFLKIVNSGSKGSLINISQMISCLGQQNVDGKRIPYGFESRTLPHYFKFDDSPEARGFIENSYISGLTAPELFFHAMGGRIGLIDTAVKTSQTGYIQRRLIKGLEDLKAEYDGTIRNNRRKIVQFSYGDDGFDSTRAENQTVKLVEMSVEEIYMHYDIAGINDERNDMLAIYTKPTITRLNKQRKETSAKCRHYIDMMLGYRDMLVERVFFKKNESNVKVPVSFQHIIANIQGQLGFSHHSSVDITPMEAFTLIEETYAKLENLHYARPTELFKVLYFFYLSPKELIVKKRFHKKALDYLLETILLRYKQAIVHPGEMVGVIAGQSIGEPTTQLTLNSVVYETPIIVRNKSGEIQKIEIGDFVKQHIEKSKKVDYMKDKDTTYAEIDEYFEVPCATENGETVWRRIEAVTQHPVINEDGTDTMLKIVTQGNREVIATKAKSFLQLVDGKIIGVEGKELKVGDYLPVSKKQLDYVPTDEKYSFGTNLEDIEKIVFSNKDCIRGFLDAYFDLNGKYKNTSIETMPIVSLEIMTHIQIMLKNIGIIANIENKNYKMKNGSFTKYYYLLVKNKQAQKLAQFLFSSSKYQDKLKKIINHKFKYEFNKEHLTVPNSVNGKNIMMAREDKYQDILFDKIVSIEEVQNTTNYAYDLTVEDTRNFDIYNGLCLRDTFHLAGVSTKSNVTRGVPRIEEILRLTRNPKNPYLTIMLNEVDQEIKERAEQYAKMIEHTRLMDVVQSVQICFDPREDATFIEKDREVIEQFYEFERLLQEAAEMEVQTETQKSKWILRMEMDPEKMLDKNITMDDIHYAISAAHGDNVTSVFSDYNDKNLVFRIRMNSSVFDKKKKKGSLESLDQSDEIYHLKNFQDSILNSIVLRGVNGINNVMPRQMKNCMAKEKSCRVEKEDGKYVPKEIWVLETTGTNLLEILAQDYIDASRTYGNDIQEIFNVLGIEAARQTIFNEFNEVMEFSDNVYINYHHLSLLCDRMTLTHHMVPIFRSGILEDDIGTIAKATFEVHTEVFLDAARHANFDEMRGVSANVMCGQYGYYGTNAFNVVLDMKEMMKMKNEAVDIKTDNERIDEMFGLGSTVKDECSKSSIMIRNNIENIQSENIAICNDSYDIGI
jgi:DNA-directed RNA polymerase beta' subunit